VQGLSASLSRQGGLFSFNELNGRHGANAACGGQGETEYVAHTIIALLATFVTFPPVLPQVTPMDFPKNFPLPYCPLIRFGTIPPLRTHPIGHSNTLHGQRRGHGGRNTRQGRTTFCDGRPKKFSR